MFKIQKYSLKRFNKGDDCKKVFDRILKTSHLHPNQCRFIKDRRYSDHVDFVRDPVFPIGTFHKGAMLHF